MRYAGNPTQTGHLVRTERTNKWWGRQIWGPNYPRVGRRGSTLNRWARHQKIAFNSQHHVWNGQELISWLCQKKMLWRVEQLNRVEKRRHYFLRFNSIYLFWDDRFNWQKGKLEGGGGGVAHWYKLLFNKERLIYMPKTCSSHLQLH